MPDCNVISRHRGGLKNGLDRMNFNILYLTESRYSDSREQSEPRLAVIHGVNFRVTCV